MTEKNKSTLQVAKGATNAQGANLETKIQYFNHKKELIRKLTTLTDNKEELNKHLENLSEIAAENDFINDRYKIYIKDNNAGYRNEDIFSIKNPDIIGDVLTFIIKRIEDKEGKLRKEIEA
jgi:superoxide dismutase